MISIATVYHGKHAHFLNVVHIVYIISISSIIYIQIYKCMCHDS